MRGALLKCTGPAGPTVASISLGGNGSYSPGTAGYSPEVLRTRESVRILRDAGIGVSPRDAVLLMYQGMEALEAERLSGEHDTDVFVYMPPAPLDWSPVKELFRRSENGGPVHAAETLAGIMEKAGTDRITQPGILGVHYSRGREISRFVDVEEGTDSGCGTLIGTARRAFNGVAYGMGWHSYPLPPLFRDQRMGGVVLSGKSLPDFQDRQHSLLTRLRS